MQEDTDVLIARLYERVDALSRLLDEREKQVRWSLDAVEKATAKAEAAQRAVNATQNEFRGALKDQAAALATKSEVSSLDNRVQALERRAAGGESRTVAFGSASSLVFNILPLVLSAIAVAAALFWKSKNT